LTKNILDIELKKKLLV